LNNRSGPTNSTKTSQRGSDHEQGLQLLPKGPIWLVGDGKQEFDDREVGEADSFEAESKNRRGSVEVPDALAILRLGAENDEWEDGEW
jgi:hypothetical protein